MDRVLNLHENVDCLIHDLIHGFPEERMKVQKDYIISMYTLFYLPNAPQLIAQIYQNLKPGGKAVLHLGYDFIPTNEKMRDK